MRASKWLGVSAAGLLAAFTLTSFTAVGGAADAASSGGPTTITLTEGVQNQPNWWFPNAPGEYCGLENFQMSLLAYRPVIWISNQDTIDYARSIASSISVNPTDTVFTVHLKSTWKWSNGQPVTAQDALYDAEVLMHASGSNPVWTDCYSGIGGLPNDWKSVTAPNATTLVFTTASPANPVWFEHNAISQIYPLPVSVWDHSSNWKAEESWILKVGVNPAAPQFRVVDGPYKYGKFVNNAYSTLVWNPAYSGPTKPKIHQINMLYETSEANLWAASLRGTFAQVGIPTQYNKDRSALVRQGFKITTQPYGFCISYAEPNLNPKDPKSSLLALRYVRQALELGLNQAGMIRLAGNMGYTDYGPVPSDPRTVYYDPSVSHYGYAYNPARGKKILEAHGWTMKHGVMTNAKGQTLSFSLLYTSGSEWMTDSAELWQADLRQEGIRLTLQDEEFNQVLTTVDNQHNWEIAWWGVGWCYEDDYYPTGAGLFEPGSSANSGDFNDPHLTELINLTHEPGTASQVTARMNAYQLYVAEVLPFLFMPSTGGYNATATWLHAPAAAWNPVQAIETYNWWYTTAR